jgi:hypothetical protein
MLTPLTQEKWSRRAADQLFHRAGFGGPPADREAFYRLGKSSGIEAAIDSLVGSSEDW